MDVDINDIDLGTGKVAVPLRDLQSLTKEAVDYRTYEAIKEAMLNVSTGPDSLAKAAVEAMFHVLGEKLGFDVTLD